jgi:hypothetical protein
MHPLTAKIVLLQRRLVWRERATAACAIVAAIIAATCGLGLIDYLFRVSDRGLRVMMTAALAAAATYAVYRWWYFPRLRRRMGPLAVARRVETEFPQLDDRLASALEFLGQSEHDATAGSAALRRAVVIEADHAVSGLPLEDVIDRRPLRRAATWAGIAMAAVVVCALVAGENVRTAAVRLLAPLGSTEWPRTNRLEFRAAPRRIAVGQAFEAELVDAGGSLPEAVQIQYRIHDGGRSEIQTEAMNRVGDTMVARRDNVRQSFEFRAEGGDDHSMPWTKVDAVEPPQLASLKFVTRPPAYTSLPAAPAERHMEVLAGTGIEVSGAAHEPLSAAKIVVGNKTIAAELRANAKGHERRDFVVPAEAWVATESGKFRLDLEGTDGVSGTVAEGSLQVLPDTPPTVAWEQPRDDLMLLATATVPIEVAVKDNLAIAAVELRYTRSDQADLVAAPIELYRGPESVAAADAPAIEQHGESRNVEYDWSLSSLKLPEGTQIVLNVAASDYRPGTGQTATSRRITIVGRDQLDARLAGEQQHLAQRLSEALKLQRATRDDVHGLRIQIRDAGQLAAGDRETLSAAELNQRRVGRSLVGAPDGIAPQVDAIIDELQMNDITSGDLAQQMARLTQGLSALAATQLPTAERELSTARKTAEASQDAATAKDLTESLANAGANQEQTIAALEQMLSEISGAADLGQVVRDLTQLREDQLVQQKSTREAIGLETLPLELRELSRQQRATLNKAADGEDALVRRYERIEQTLERLAGDLAQRDAAAAERLGGAVELAKLLGISNLMQQVGQDLTGNHVGQALDGETRVADCLQELIDDLRERRLRPEEMVKKLRAAEQQLAALRAELARLQQQLAQLEQQGGGSEARQPNLTSTSEQQKQLQDKIAQLARQLRQLQATDAGKSASQAAEKLGGAKPGGENSGGPGGSQSSPSSAAQQAEQDLANAARQLAARRQQAEEDLSREILQRFQGELQTMISDQQEVIRATTEWEARLRDDKPGRENSKTEHAALTNLAGKERELAALAHDHSQLLAGLHVIGLALGQAADRLGEAAGQLDRRKLGTVTQQSEQQALARLQQIAAALEQARQAAGNQNPGSPPGNSGGGGNQPKRPSIELFEAKLLRSLQADLQERSQALQQRMVAQPQPTEESRAADERDAEELAAEQGHLAELVQELRTRDNKNDDQAH